MGLAKFLMASFRPSREAAVARPSAGASASPERVAPAAYLEACSAVEAIGLAAALDRASRA